MRSPSKAKTLPRMLALGAFTTSIVAVTSVACNGSAVGVEACQIIEEARCDAAPKVYMACNKQPNIIVPKILTTPEVNNCKILYRDQCRVGIENTTAGKDPSKDQANLCVKQIDAAAACGAGMLAACNGATVNDPTMHDPASTSGCYAFVHPEILSECNFIATPPTTSAAATTATTSTTGSGGGSGG